jgi:capsular exopolysaccharide synthesis family protein
VLVTSAEEGVGKSTIAANLASLSARGGDRVLAIDADMRRPSLHALLGVSRAPGLVEHLAESGRSYGRFVQRSPAGIDVMTAGQSISNAGDFLSLPRMRHLLQEASEAYEVVVIDSAPVLAAADAEALSANGLVDVVFVVDTKSKRRNVRRAINRLKLVDASIAGFVVNRESHPTAYAHAY